LEATGIDWTAVAERALELICLYQAAGAAFFLALFAPRLPHTRARVQRGAGIIALCAMAVVLAEPGFEAARMAGGFAGMHDRTLLQLAWHSSNGAATIVQFAGLVLLKIGLSRADESAYRAAHLGGHAERGAAWSVFVSVAGAVLASGALILTGHTSVNPKRVLLAPLLSVHLLVGAFWFGSLWPLWLTVRHESPKDAALVLRGFTHWARWLVPCIALAGLSMALLLIHNVATLRRPYGLLLLGKLCAFTLLMGLAALNRWRFTPELNDAPRAAQRALYRALTLEYLLIAVVLAMSSTLTTLFSPED
jgi:putative copper export protein